MSEVIVSILGGYVLMLGCYYYLLLLLDPSSAVGSVFYMAVGSGTLLFCYREEVSRHVNRLLLSITKKRHSCSNRLDWSNYAKLIGFLLVYLIVPSDDPDIRRLLIQSLPLEGDPCTMQDYYSSSTPPTVITIAATYMGDLVISHLRFVAGQELFVDSANIRPSSPSSSSSKVIRRSTSWRRRDSYYRILASIVFKHTCRSIGSLLTRLRDQLVVGTIQSILSCLSGLDSMIMDALELLIGSTTVTLVTALSDTASMCHVAIATMWRYSCGQMQWSMAQGLTDVQTHRHRDCCINHIAAKRKCCSPLSNTINDSSMRKVESGRDDSPHTTQNHLRSIWQLKRPSLIKMDEGLVNSNNTNSLLEVLFGLMLASKLFLPIHSSIHYTVAIHQISKLHDQLLTVSSSSVSASLSSPSDVYMMHFNARRIALWLTCLIAHRFRSQVTSYRWLVGIIHRHLHI